MCTNTLLKKNTQSCENIVLPLLNVKAKDTQCRQVNTRSDEHVRCENVMYIYQPWLNMLNQTLLCVI